METGYEAAPTEEMVRFLEEAGRRFREPMEYGEAVRTAAQCVVPLLADFAVAWVGREGDEPHVEVVHRLPADEPRMRELVLGAAEAFRRVVREEGTRSRRHWRWVPIMSEAALEHVSRGDPGLARVLRELGVRSLIVVPFRSGGQPFGVLALARTGEEHPFSAPDLAVAQVIGRRASIAIEGSAVHEGMRTDLARRGRLDQALRKWTRAFHSAGWGAAIVDGTDFRIDVANPAFARMHGHTEPADLTGKFFADLLAPDHAGEPGRWSAMGSESPNPYESVHRRADGSTFPALVNVTCLGQEAGTEAYVVTVQDLTDLKRAEERLRRAQRMEAVGRLAGGVAHEVNNMMTIVLGFADLLNAASDLGEERRRDVEEIRKAATRAGKITRQLLAFSRQQVLQPSALDFNQVVGEMAPVLRLMLPANIRLETLLAPASGSVLADRGQLEQVLINLAFNARDAMPGGGAIRLITESRHLTAEFGLRTIGIPIPPGDYALLSVVDTGAGMDQTTVGQIFEPFFTTKPLGKGTGLGLSTVYGIVKQSGGYVWAESTVGQGTTVTVCLPQVERSVAPIADRLAARPVEQASGTVLVVEDEEGVRGLACRLLRQEGFDVLEARDGMDAMRVLERGGRPIHLLLTDVVVPGTGLDELERRVRERHGDLPVLYMSGYPYDDIVQRGLLAASQPFLQKPFTAAELVGSVHRLLGDRVVRGGGGQRRD